MNKARKLLPGLVFGVAGSQSFAAFAADDYSSITGAVSATAIVAGIGVIAGVMFLPRVSRWGFRQIMALIK